MKPFAFSIPLKTSSLCASLKLLKEEIKLSVCKDTISKLMGKEEEFDKFYEKIEYLELRTCILQQFFMECRFNDRDIFNTKRLKNIIKEMDNSEHNKDMYV